MSFEVPRLTVLAPSVTHHSTFLLAGEGWPLDGLELRANGEPLWPSRVLEGSLWNGLLVPNADGEFLVECQTATHEPGLLTLVAEQPGGPAADAEVEIVERPDPGPEVPRHLYSKPDLRAEAFIGRRLRDGESWLPGQREVFEPDWEEIHRDQTVVGEDGIPFFTAPVRGGCNWVPLGPAPFTNGKGSRSLDESGRIRSVAIDPQTPDRLYVGTASGGLWKSTDGGHSWAPKTDDKFSLAIGALAIDPTNPRIVYAGTGEFIPGTNIGYYGQGLLKSTNHGETWSPLGTTQFDLAEIARIVIDPANTANLYVAASNGVWHGTAGGSTWTRLTATPATDVVLVRDPSKPGVDQLIVGLQNAAGLAVATRTSGGAWSTFRATTSPAFPNSTSRRTILGVCRDKPQHLYAAFADLQGQQLAAIAKSADHGATWTACSLPSGGRNYQANYNLSILPHPTKPDTVILTLVEPWRSTNGGQTWTNVQYGPRGTGVHVDDHAVAYHPTTHDSIFLATDGGLFFSADLGNNWQARNLDLATLQLYDFGQHPQYEGILVAGAQDNGGFHHSGAPIWKYHWVRPGETHNSMDGDGVMAQIDPFDGYVHYYGANSQNMYRSDDAGRFFGTHWKAWPGTEWWRPFFPDPRVAGVLYSGGSTLRRSPDRGNTWTEITGALGGSVRAVGFRAGSPRTVVVGTTAGKVFRVTGPSTGAWNTTNVRTDDITLTGLPAGQEISSLAVDPAGNVWATTSSLMKTEAPNEFTTDHVHRLDAGATAWVSKSTGLARANPVNTILIDPRSADRVFCGADRGAFSWDAQTQTWKPWDQGLPNAPVIKLMVHAPSRKVRAATYGRGLWERSLDDVGCSDHFLYLRDHIADAGHSPTANGVPHPYVRGQRCWHWQSEDILVDPAPFQTPNLVTSPTELAARVVHRGGQRGANHIYVTVHNKGPFAVTRVKVRAFFGPASAGLPAFPSGLLGNPFGWTSGPGVQSDWTPVGAAFDIPRLEAGTTRLAAWNFVIPSSAPSHSCLLAFVTSAEDPFSPGSVTSPDALVIDNRKVTLKNLDLGANPGGGGGGGGGGVGGQPRMPGFTTLREIRMHAGHGEVIPMQPAIGGRLPPEAVAVVALHRDSPVDFLRYDFPRSPPMDEAEEIFRSHADELAAAVEELQHYDLEHPILAPVQPEELVALGEAFVTDGEPLHLAVWVFSPHWSPEEQYTVDIVQLQDEEPRGGYTVELLGSDALEASIAPAEKVGDHTEDLPG